MEEEVTTTNVALLKDDPTLAGELFPLDTLLFKVLIQHVVRFKQLRCVLQFHYYVQNAI